MSLALRKLTYNQDGLATVNNADFLQDPRFQDAYEAGKATGSWGDFPVHWRAYIACWAADRASKMDGDFVECGVNRGGLALTTMRYCEFQDLSKTYYLLDTFKGFDSQYVDMREKGASAVQHVYSECYEDVCKTFAPYDNVKIVRGSVPDTLDEVDAEAVAYLSIDMNCVQPEIAAAEFFWPKLTSGAIVLLDDYAQPGFEAQKEAFDIFASRRSVEVLALPTGQGLLIRP